MKPLALLDSHSTSSGLSVAVVASLAICLLLSCALVLRGCMNEHYRAQGHGDSGPRG